MPTIKQSQKFDRSRLGPVTETAGVTSPAIPSPQQPTVISPFMICPMPTVAASFDTFQRQFYGRGPNPQQRIFQPVL